MSAIEFILNGGVAKIGGELPKDEQKKVADTVKSFANKVKSKALQLQIPASKLTITRAAFLFCGRDTQNYHFIFAESPSGTVINYRDLSEHGRLELATIAHQVRLEIGDVVWGFSMAIGVPYDEEEKLLDVLARQYVDSIIQLLLHPQQKISEEAVASPEIASGIEKFRNTHSSSRTAFIMMQFSDTKAHQAIVSAIKEALLKHSIIGLRADDKEYLDELFPNVKVYMHACDFGLAVFERITSDDFNPNVSLEVGYMLGLRKDVLLLKDSTLKALQTDLTGRLYREFDTQMPAQSIPMVVEKWLSDKGHIK